MASNSVLIVPPPSSTTATTNDIRGLKPPVEIPSGWLWLWITLGVLVLAAAVVVLIRKLSKGRQPPLVPLDPPHVRARRKLAEALLLIAQPQPFCFAVSDAARVYLEERFQLRAPERTTEEFLRDLQATPHLSAEQKQSLGAFLEHCDLVKFARYEPTEAALRELHDSALRLVDETQYDRVMAVAPPVSPELKPAEMPANAPPPPA